MVAIEVQVLMSGVFQRVSSDSLASCRSVRRVKQTWIRGASRECTGEAMVLGAQALNKSWRSLHGQMKGYEVRDAICEVPK